MTIRKIAKNEIENGNVFTFPDGFQVGLRNYKDGENIKDRIPKWAFKQLRRAGEFSRQDDDINGRGHGYVCPLWDKEEFEVYYTDNEGLTNVRYFKWHERKYWQEIDFQEENPTNYKKWLKGGALNPTFWGNKSWREEEGEEHRQWLNNNGYDWDCIGNTREGFTVFHWSKS